LSPSSGVLPENVGKTQKRVAAGKQRKKKLANHWAKLLYSKREVFKPGIKGEEYGGKAAGLWKRDAKENEGRGGAGKNRDARKGGGGHGEDWCGGQPERTVGGVGQCPSEVVGGRGRYAMQRQTKKRKKGPTKTFKWLRGVTMTEVMKKFRMGLS